MQLIELKEVENASREQFNGIKREAQSLDCFSNASVNGVQTFYCTARMAPVFPPVNFQAEELAYRQALGKTGHSG